ncbi:MAG TPA: HAMP domain-containing sensor histidine kinase [candidate division Zixibacteria bacterium]|nr:HAMP domain-containing sensor histidine kinase [candidate division Zixibacteria bacterium]
MVLSKKAVVTIVVLLVVALAGLLTIQAILLDHAYRSEQQAFQRNAQAALGAAVGRLEAIDVARSAINVFGNSSDSSYLSIMMLTGDFEEVDSMQHVECSVTTMTGNNYAYASAYAVESPKEKNIIKVINTDSLVDTIKLNTSSVSLLNILGNAPQGSGPGDSQRVSIDWNKRRISADMESDSSEVPYMLRIVQQLVTGKPLPIKERLNVPLVDSIIDISLAEAEIDQPYQFAVVKHAGDSVVMAKSDDTSEWLPAAFRARLFPNDLFPEIFDLVLNFPRQQSYLWWRLAPMLVLSGLFSLVIGLSFFYTVRVIFEQRRGAALMIDFVNNLTHEFKTPISTVALACEAIERDDVAGDSERVRRFSSMIMHENRRMRHQTEKILQLATIEKGDWELKGDAVAINPLIARAVESYELLIKQKGGMITVDLEATDPEVAGDEVHLANAVHNLIDNAVKYSPEAPKIDVRSFDHFNGVQVEIEDHGIGIASEDQKRVFEKYFRVPSGNVHDVKGFGLGLSYVKMIIERHGGTISLKSALGDGTKVSVWLPTIKEKRSDRHG